MIKDVVLRLFTPLVTSTMKMLCHSTRFTTSMEESIHSTISIYTRAKKEPAKKVLKNSQFISWNKELIWLPVLTTQPKFIYTPISTLNIPPNKLLRHADFQKMPLLQLNLLQIQRLLCSPGTKASLPSTMNSEPNTETLQLLSLIKISSLLLKLGPNLN